MRWGDGCWARPGATWALWLLALSPFWLLYGRMIRAYSLTMALALLLTWLLLQALRRGGRWWLIYAVAGAALLYTDYSGLAVVAAHGLYLLVTLRRQGWRRIGGWFVAAAVMGLAFTPWLAVVATQVARDVR
jgi:mannosyltransferase